MKAYWIAHVNVDDIERYTGYTDLAPAAFAKYGAKLLARGGQSINLEGPTFQRSVVIEFSSYEQALACYRSAEYQQAKNNRLDVAQALVRHAGVMTVQIRYSPTECLVITF